MGTLAVRREDSSDWLAARADSAVRSLPSRSRRRWRSLLEAQRVVARDRVEELPKRGAPLQLQQVAAQLVQLLVRRCLRRVHALLFHAVPLVDFVRVLGTHRRFKLTHW